MSFSMDDGDLQSLGRDGEWFNFRYGLGQLRFTTADTENAETTQSLILRAFSVSSVSAVVNSYVSISYSSIKTAGVC